MTLLYGFQGCLNFKICNLSLETGLSNGMDLSWANWWLDLEKTSAELWAHECRLCLNKKLSQPSSLASTCSILVYLMHHMAGDVLATWSQGKAPTWTDYKFLPMAYAVVMICFAMMTCIALVFQKGNTLYTCGSEAADVCTADTTTATSRQLGKYYIMWHGPSSPNQAFRCMGSWWTCISYELSPCNVLLYVFSANTNMFIKT